jgi:hypothetical protein
VVQCAGENWNKETEKRLTSVENYGSMDTPKVSSIQILQGLNAENFGRSKQA